MQHRGGLSQVLPAASMRLNPNGATLVSDVVCQNGPALTIWVEESVAALGEVDEH